MAILKKSPLEFFVASFVKQKSRMKVPQVYINKAIMLIDEKLDPTCCDNPSGVVTYPTFRDNLLTRTIKSLLVTMPKSGANVKSLQRAKAALELYRDGCCN